MFIWKPVVFMLTTFLVVHPHPLGINSGPDILRRDLAGLFGDDIFTSGTDITAGLKTFSNHEYTSNIFGGTITSGKKTATETTLTETGTSHSIIGTLPAYTTSLALSTMESSSSTYTSTVPPIIPTGVIPDAPSTPPAEAMEWKVIGLVIVSVSFVAAVILGTVFFDSWWGFLRDLVLGKPKNQGMEDMVPDWEKRSWEFKLASEDGHRYPTPASLENITKNGDSERLAINPFDSHPTILPSPQPPYMSDSYDPHPLDPLFRRPSTKMSNSPHSITSCHPKFQYTQTS